MTKKLIFGLNLLMALSLILSACGAATEEPPEVPDLGTINVGYLPIIAFTPLFVAQEKGYFAEQGLTVEMQSFRTGDDMIAPLSLGQLDVGGGETGPALFNAINQDLDVRVVSANARQTEGHGAVPLVVRTELLSSGQVSSVADLAGLKVAVNVERGMAEYLLSKALEQGGLALEDVEVITIPFPEMPQALANAAVDAAILPHPLASAALRPGEGGEPPIGGVLIEGDKIADGPQNGVTYYGARFLDPANREVAVRFMMALLKAGREMVGEEWRQDDVIIQAILSFTTVPEPAARNAIVYFFDPNGEIFRPSTEDIQAYHVGRGYTEFDTPLPLDQVIDDSFLQEALDRLGRVDS